MVVVDPNILRCRWPEIISLWHQEGVNSTYNTHTQDISGPGHLGTEHMRHLGTGNFGIGHLGTGNFGTGHLGTGNFGTE